MAVDGVPNLRPAEPAAPAIGRRKVSQGPTGGGEAKADFKETLAARLERVREHAANMRTYTGRAKVQLGGTPSAGNAGIDIRA